MEKQKTISALGLTRRLFLSFVFLMVGSIAFAQTEASGTIVDNTGEPIIGATVMETGTSNGTLTDIDGNFRLKTATGLLHWLCHAGVARFGRYEHHFERQRQGTLRGGCHGLHRTA